MLESKVISMHSYEAPQSENLIMIRRTLIIEWF